MANEQRNYRIRRSQGGWFVRVYGTWDFSQLIEEHGPYTFAEADAKANSLDIADGDKGEERADVRGYNVTR